jgi:hypothetical protein
MSKGPLLLKSSGKCNSLGLVLGEEHTACAYPLLPLLPDVLPQLHSVEDPLLPLLPDVLPQLHSVEDPLLPLLPDVLTQLHSVEDPLFSLNGCWWVEQVVHSFTARGQPGLHLLQAKTTIKISILNTEINRFLINGYCLTYSVRNTALRV